jgi:hypothetical protein
MWVFESEKARSAGRPGAGAGCWWGFMEQKRCADARLREGFQQSRHANDIQHPLEIVGEHRQRASPPQVNRKRSYSHDVAYGCMAPYLAVIPFRSERWRPLAAR